MTDIIKKIRIFFNQENNKQEITNIIKTFTDDKSVLFKGVSKRKWLPKTATPIITSTETIPYYVNGETLFISITASLKIIPSGYFGRYRGLQFKTDTKDLSIPFTINTSIYHSDGYGDSVGEINIVVSIGKNKNISEFESILNMMKEINNFIIFSENDFITTINTRLNENIELFDDFLEENSERNFLQILKLKKFNSFHYLSHLKEKYSKCKIHITEKTNPTIDRVRLFQKSIISEIKDDILSDIKELIDEKNLLLKSKECSIEMDKYIMDKILLQLGGLLSYKMSILLGVLFAVTDYRKLEYFINKYFVYIRNFIWHYNTELLDNDNLISLTIEDLKQYKPQLPSYSWVLWLIPKKFLIQKSIILRNIIDSEQLKEVYGKSLPIELELAYDKIL